MDLQLESIEKKALSKLLLDMMKVDGNVAVEEFTLLKNIRIRLGISDTELKESKYLSVLGSISLLKEMDTEKKNVAAKLIAEMVKADGDIHKKEIKMLKMIYQLLELQIPDMYA